MDTKRLLHGSRGDNAQKTRGSFVAYILVVIALGLALVLIISTKCSRETAEKSTELINSTEPINPTVVSPTIFSFTMTPNPVRPGETATLAWETNAERVYLIAKNHGDSVTVDCLGGFPGASGSYSVKIRDQNWFALYTIKEGALPTSCMDSDMMLLCGCDEIWAVSNPIGVVASVSVLCSPESWFFLNPPEACPASSASVLKPQEMVMQAFAGGTIILVRETEDLYVLYRSYSRLQSIYAGDCGGYQRQCDWDEVWAWLLAENPYHYLVGWGEEEARRVIDELGPAQAPEIHYTGYHQCVAGEYGSCYISGPNGLVYKINAEGYGGGDGAWRIVQQSSSWRRRLGPISLPVSPAPLQRAANPCDSAALCRNRLRLLAPSGPSLASSMIPPSCSSSPV